MTPIPDLCGIDVAFGNIKHMPKYETLPDDFKKRSGNAYVDFVSRWFSCGVKGNEFKPRPGVDKGKAIIALRAIMASFEPKHEHKIAGVAYLMSQWFEEPGNVEA